MTYQGTMFDLDGEKQGLCGPQILCDTRLPSDKLTEHHLGIILFHVCKKYKLDTEMVSQLFHTWHAFSIHS